MKELTSLKTTAEKKAVEAIGKAPSPLPKSMDPNLLPRSPVLPSAKRE
jgi:hypothetical protein